MPSRFTPDVIALLEHIPNAFYALDKDFCFVYANRKVQQLLNKTEPEVTGKNIWDLFPAWKEMPLYGILNKAATDGEPAHFEEYSPRNHAWFEGYVYPSEHGIAVYINDITERKKGESRMRLLNKASQILAAEHDLSEALNRISNLLIPEFADWFTVDHLNDSEVELLVIGNAKPENIKWGIEYRSRTKVDIDKPKPGSVGWVIRIGMPVMLNDITDDLIRAAADDAAHYEVLKRLDIKANIIVPIPMRGKTIGALTFISSNAARRYDDADMRFATDLAVMIGLSIENTRIFQEMKKEFAQRIRETNTKLVN